MQLIELVCKDKHLQFKNHSRQYFELVSDNADYVVNIDFQDERQNAMFLRVVFPDGAWRELAVPADGNVELPLWALQFRLLDIGITSGDYYATLPTKIAVKGSIKAICGDDQIEIPDQDTVAELIRLVNGIVIEGGGLPPVTSLDNGKIPQVNQGDWAIQHPILGEESIHLLTNMEIEQLLTD